MSNRVRNARGIIAFEGIESCEGVGFGVMIQAGSVDRLRDCSGDRLLVGDESMVIADLIIRLRGDGKIQTWCDTWSVYRVGVV
jgi:hypothetical protein